MWLQLTAIPHEVSLQEALNTAPWDYVTLQQVSHKSWRCTTFQPHLSLLHGLVRQLAPKAKILLHQTWAYRLDSPFLSQNSLTQDIMFEGIRNAYAHYAAELVCGVLPSGEAVQQFRHTTERAFSWPELDFDYQNAEAPSLPRQKHSLAVGLSTIVRKAYRRCNWIPITSTPTDATWLVVCGLSA